MIKLSCKIWAAANAAVFLIFFTALFHKGFETCFHIVGVAAVLSVPAAVLLYFLFRVLHYLKGSALFSWLVLVVGTAASATATYILFQYSYQDAAAEFNFVLPLCFVCGYSAILLLAPAIDHLFKTFQYGNEPEAY